MTTADTPTAQRRWEVDGQLLTRNLPALEEGFDHIIEHPELHDQDRWRRGVTRCYGSRIAELNGGKWLHEEDNCDLLVSDQDEPGARPADDGRWCISVPERVKNLTGITAEEANDLFYDAGYAEEIREVLDRIRETALAESNAA